MSDDREGRSAQLKTSRRLSCDAALVRITHAPDGSVLDVGRRTRTVPPALRRALETRDRGCRFPGCGSRFTDAHHVKHWADGGQTSLTNTTLLCKHHHRLVHEGGWRVMWAGDGQPTFVDPRGGTHYDARPKAPELAEHPVRALVEANRRRGAEPDWRTAGARWKREDDIPRDVYFRALEATG
ncbi:MAG TPA: HNH endonuclease [Longimicrobiales bacterium]|nr:HNH endonuclease [Longimicrobiales bacterium]